jgi:hypothetical protein
MSITLDPLQLPSVSLREREGLPNCTAIYFALDSRDRILYVGKAKNLAGRWKQHHRLFELEKINGEFPVRIAWSAWDVESLDEAEKSLIINLHPLLNNTKVEFPAVIPAEEILRDFLKTFSRRLIVLGIEPAAPDRLPRVHLKYDPTDYSAKGTAAKIKEFIERNRDKNTSLKFKRRKWYRDFHAFTVEIPRPGSRVQRTMAKRYRAFNRWECGCNGVIIEIAPTYSYREYKEKTAIVKLAGINCRAIARESFAEAFEKEIGDFSGLSCYAGDPIPLLWTRS